MTSTWCRISEDHSNFVPLWTAEPRPEPGMRQRWTDKLSAQGRWVRLTVRGGDSAYSVAELQLFEHPPSVMPPLLHRLAGQNQAAAVRSSLLYLIAAFGLFLAVTSGRSRRWVVALAALIPLIAIGFVVDAISTGWPLVNREVAFVRATAAAIALLAAARAAIPGQALAGAPLGRHGRARHQRHRRLSGFLQPGRPQFWNHEQNRPEFVHTNDLRVYQPFAKYFKELGYDGVYTASVLAYAEDHRGGRSTRSEIRSCAASAITGSGASTRSKTRFGRCVIGSARSAG